MDDFTEVADSVSPRFFYGWVVMGTALVVAIVAYAVHYSFGIFFKPLASEFNWTRAMTSGAFSLYMLSRGAFGILTGWTTDKYGPKVTVAAGGFFIGLGLLLTSQISALWQLYLFYSLLVGLGVSVAFAPLVATVSRWFISRRGLVTGIVLAGIGLGTAIMPRPAGYLIGNYGWSMSYIIMGVVALIIIVSAGLLLRREPKEMGLLPYGKTGAVEVRSSGNGKSAAEKGGLSLREAVRTRLFWVLFAITILFATCLYMVMIHIVPYATDVGISKSAAVGLLVVIGISTICGRLAIGWVSDTVGRKLALALCLLFQGVAVYLLTGVTSVQLLYVIAIVFGLAYGGVVTQLPLIAGELFGLHSLGAIVGLEMLGTSFGGAIGPIIGGYVFDVTASYYFAFLTSAVGLLIATVLILFLKAPGRRN
ncbi:MFS transporter [Chloroflexota bacterium]